MTYMYLFRYLISLAQLRYCKMVTQMLCVYLAYLVGCNLTQRSLKRGCFSAGYVVVCSFLVRSRLRFLRRLCRCLKVTNTNVREKKKSKNFCIINFCVRKYISEIHKFVFDIMLTSSSEFRDKGWFLL